MDSYRVLRNGLIIQFAFYNPAPGSGQMDFNFPIAFTNACISVCVTNRYPASIYVGGDEVYNVSKSSFSYDSYRGSYEKIPFSMIAIGY